MHALAAAALLLVTPLVPGVAQTSGTHAKAYWRAIAANKFALPDGATAAQLAPELVANLGSPDPELRDDLAISILTSWIYSQKLLTPDDLRPLIATLTGNLRQGIGETGTDGVLRRSFSALTLSIVAARDNEAPFLSAAEQAALVDAAIAYLHDERDVRGYDPVKGWMHSAAHTSDLLKFLARGASFPVAAQARVLEALAAKNRDAAAPFSQGEDERMARVVISIVRRADFDRAAYRAWLEKMQTMSKFPDPASVDALRAQQNARHLLTALWTELSVDERPSEGANFARQSLRDALKTVF